MNYLKKKKKVLRLQRLVCVFASVRLTSPGADGQSLGFSLNQSSAARNRTATLGGVERVTAALPAGASILQGLAQVHVKALAAEKSWRRLTGTLSSDLLGPLAGALPDMPEGKAGHTSSSHTPLPEKAVPASRVSFGISGLSGIPGLQACMRPCLDSTACVPLTRQGSLILF